METWKLVIPFITEAVYWLTLR